MQPPTILYHMSSSENRESILEHGLLRSYSETADLAKEFGEPDWEACGGIFFSTLVSDQEGIDAWEVDVSGLDLVPDDTTDYPEGEVWWVTWTDPVVGPERLRLLSAEERMCPVGP